MGEPSGGPIVLDDSSDVGPASARKPKRARSPEVVEIGTSRAQRFLAGLDGSLSDSDGAASEEDDQLGDDDDGVFGVLQARLPGKPRAAAAAATAAGFSSGPGPRPVLERAASAPAQVVSPPRRALPRGAAGGSAGAGGAAGLGAAAGAAAPMRRGASEGGSTRAAVAADKRLERHWARQRAGAFANRELSCVLPDALVPVRDEARVGAFDSLARAIATAFAKDGRGFRHEPSGAAGRTIASVAGLIVWTRQ